MQRINYDIDDIKSIFKSKKPSLLGRYKNVAILIGLININGNINVVFEKRSKTVSQPSDISFIGGHIEENETPLEAVLRETTEETSIGRENINVISHFGKILNFNFLVADVFIAEFVNVHYEDFIKNDEVEEFIFIPLSDLLMIRPDIYKSKIVVERSESFPYNLIENGRDYPFYNAKDYSYFYKLYKDKKDIVIWGLTGKIIHYFTNHLKSNKIDL